MILHKTPAPARGFSGGEPSAPPVLDFKRILAALGFVVILFLLALLAWRAGWDAGSAASLHMAEVAFGAVVGVLLGEKAALANG